MAPEKTQRPRIHDISPEIGVGTPVWPGDTPFELEWSSSLAKGDPVNVARVTLSPHTGCHADAPLHLVTDGGDSASQPLHPFLGRVRVISWVGKGEIDGSELEKLNWNGVERVLFRTRAGDELQKLEDGIGAFTPSAARLLARVGIILAGIDSASVDAFSSEDLPVHHIFVENNVSILESLELADIPEGDYDRIALPLRIRGADASPVRAVLRELS